MLATAAIWPDTSFGHAPMLHIHGWCCDHRAMLPVARAVPNRAHLLIDLPGHGRSPAADDLSIAAHARALLEAAPEGAILVGHSMGGQVALAAAALAPPRRISGAILLDPAHILPIDKALETGHGIAAQLAARPPSEIIAAFARSQLVGPPDDPEAFDALVSAMARTPEQTARAQWDAILAYAGSGGAEAALAALAVPTLVIAAARPVNRPADLARASRCITTGQVAAAGHMLQFEAMDQIAPMVRRWLLVSGLS
jgi:pimeloyl-ACP methyl ester carboxylesterase